MTDTARRVRCLAGTVPIQLSPTNICNSGFYCPNNTQSNPPEYCPPTRECQYIRSQSARNVCTEPQGLYEPIICPSGSFCPNGGQELIQCPAHHYCPEGTSNPIKCTSLSICPAGSFREFDLTGFLLMGLCDLTLFVLSWWLKSRLKRRATLARMSCCEAEGESPAGYLSRNDFVSSDVHELVASILHSSSTSDNNGLKFEYSDLSYTIPHSELNIIFSMSGLIKQGSLHAIMGASGAGKSTFVDLITGEKEPEKGSVTVNGVNIKISDQKSVIGYVAQNVVLLPELTVRETMMHSARIRLPRSWTDVQCTQHVDRIIVCLGLGHVQHSIVGDIERHGLSGGEYKRACIGVELAAAPMALFLDEPTSGLDSSSALSVIRLLRELTRAGMTVVIILHQPRKEIFNCLDSLLLLHRGKEIYQGPREDIRSYFESLGHVFTGNSNIADLVLDIISSGKNDSEPAKDTSVKGKEPTIDASTSDSYQVPFEDHFNQSGKLALSRRRASWLRQFWLCLTRSLKQQQRRTSSFYLEIAVGGIAGLIIGLSLYSYRGQHVQGIYLSPFERLSSSANPNTPAMIALMVCMAIGLAASPSGVKTFGEENILRYREAKSGHSQSAYYMAKVVSTFPRLALSALHFTSLYTILATPRMSFWENFGIVVMYFYAIYGLASCCSFTVNKSDGPLVAVIVCLIVSVLGGYGPSLYVVRQWHLEWLWRMFPGTWASEAYIDCTFRQAAYLYDIQGAAEATGFTIGRFSLDIGMIFILGSFYRMVAFGSMLISKF